MKTGVKQRCVIVPTLFSIFISAVLTALGAGESSVNVQFRMDGKLGSMIFNLHIKAGFH